MAALLIFGALSFKKMGVGNLPDVDFPTANISLSYPGASPELMELEIVDPIEEAVLQVQGIKNITSSSSLGRANVNVEFNLNKDINLAIQEIQAAIGQVTRQLPKDLLTPTVSKMNPEDFPVLFMMVTSEKLKLPDLMSFVRDRIKPELTKIEGVGNIFLMGYADPLRRVELDNAKLKRFALTANDVYDAIQNEHSELPAGQIRTEEKEQSVRLVGEVSNVKDLAKLAIQKRGGQPNYSPISLAQIADIKDSTEDATILVRASGVPGIGIGVMKQKGHNPVKVADRVRAEIAKIQKNLPPEVNAKLTVDSTDYIRESVAELTMTLVLSAILTALVCWLFLGSWQATLNVILAIPTSVLGTFIALSALNFTLNSFTLLGLSLAIGIVVDDAIMVLENIVRHREMGKSKEEAALTGSNEITGAAIAATIAIGAIFLPVAMMNGIVGKYLFQFGITLTVAVAISLLEALTLTPMRCSQFLQVSEERTSWIGRSVESMFAKTGQAYGVILEKALHRRWLTVGLALAFFLGSLIVFGSLRKELVPPQDQSFIAVQIFTPPGTPLSATEKKTREVEAFLSARPEIKNFEAFVGGFPNGQANQSSVFVTLKPKSERPKDATKGSVLTQQEYIGIYREALKDTKGAMVFFMDLSQQGFAGTAKGFPVEFAIQGPREEVLVETSEKIKKSMTESGLLTDVNSDFRPSLPEIQLIPNREQALARGVSIADITRTASLLIGGQEAGKYSVDGHRWKIKVMAGSPDKNSVDRVLSYEVRNNRGQPVPLSKVMTVIEQASNQTINRKNRERSITITANVARNVSQSVALQNVEGIASKAMPSGYHFALSGNSEAMNDSFESLWFAILLGLVFSYMVLASQYNSFVDPLTILLALPFGMSGAFLSLYLGGQSLNMYSFIGLVLLMGIAKKNSILLVDFTNQLRAQGKSVRDSLMEACPIRLRPILMTSVATIVGAVPAVMAWGPGAEVRIPMGLAVIGGVLVSTVLTLFVVPCVYSLFASPATLAEIKASLSSWLPRRRERLSASLPQG